MWTCSGASETRSMLIDRVQCLLIKLVTWATIYLENGYLHYIILICYFLTISTYNNKSIHLFWWFIMQTTHSHVYVAHCVKRCQIAVHHMTTTKVCNWIYAKNIYLNEWCNMVSYRISLTVLLVGSISRNQYNEKGIVLLNWSINTNILPLCYKITLYCKG